MTLLNDGRLTVSGDVDGDGSQETGTFVMEGNLTITSGIRTGYLLSNLGGNVNAFLGSLLGGGQSRQEGIFLNLGAGARSWDVEFRGWEGSPGKWGNTGNGGSATDATGDDALRQMEVFLEYLGTADIDSRSPATWEYGEHHSGGDYDAVDVVVEQPQFTRAAQDGNWFDGQITLLAAADIKEQLDAIPLLEF